MSAATALARGPKPVPQLAEKAVREAMAKADLTQATGVILFLSGDFARQPQTAVLAAARAAGCLQIFGMIAHGVVTESGWVLDQPAAAALVLGGRFSLVPGGASAPTLSVSANTSLPADWQGNALRYGLLQDGAAIWQQGRQISAGHADAGIAGAIGHLAVSPGWRQLGAQHTVSQVNGHDLSGIDHASVAENLLRALPPDLRERDRLPVHQIGLLRENDPCPIPILAANADGSVTLAVRLQAGERIRWTLRQPLAAEADMREKIDALASRCSSPAFGLMFSCMGRGPFFYGDDDRDFVILRERFPGLPILGAYGSGQIAPQPTASGRQLQNAVVTALYEAEHV